MLLQYIFIGFGGAAGAIMRVALGKILPSAILGIPCQILFVNVLGCFVMGLLTELMAVYWSASDNVRYFLMPGLLGGFTTFSGFALEFGTLFERNEYIPAVIYAIFSFGLSISCFFAGIKITKIFVF